MTRRLLLYALFGALCSAGLAAQTAPAVSPAASWTDAQIEDFLLHAKVIRTKDSKKGVTGTIRATLSDGTVTHDAQIQQIDESLPKFETASGTEFNFRDSWAYNVAAYRLDRLIGLNMIPVSVPRDFRSKPGAFTWWVDDVMMDEEARLKQKVVPPNMERWNEQMQLVRVLDQLIYNVDRNLGNLLITKDWRIWPIDHSRAFRTHHQLKSAANVTRCDRQVLDGLKRLDQESLKKSLSKFLTQYEIDAILKRRDLIVSIIENRGSAAMFDRASQ
jgi:hypothetical protein